MTTTNGVRKSTATLSAISVSLTAAGDAEETLIGNPAPTDSSYSASQLTVTVTALPTDGSVTLSNGALVKVGEKLTVAQLTGLEFAPTPGLFNQSSTFTYSVKDPAGVTATGSDTLKIGADTSPPKASSATLTVAANSGATPANILAPTDANFKASQLTVTVTALPTDGRVLLSNGKTAVTVGENLTVAQLTGLEFQPTAGIFGESSTFTYSVKDPAGLTASGSETLKIAADTSPPIATNGALTVAGNGAAAAINIPLPSDPNYTTSQLTVTVTALPTDGAVLLSNGTTAVTVGETLTVAQLTGLEFQATAGVFGQSSTFTYSVEDPAGLSATGSETLTIAANTTTSSSSGLTVEASQSGTAVEVTGTVELGGTSNIVIYEAPAGQPIGPGNQLGGGVTTVVNVPDGSWTANLISGLSPGTYEIEAVDGSASAITSVTVSATPTPVGSQSSTVSTGSSDTSPPTATNGTLTVAANANATSIGIPAPTDPNYAASQLTVTVTALPTDGTVLLSNGTTAVTVGEALTMAQLTGLEFQATAGVFGQSSTFTYSVEDPVGLSAAGSEVLAIGPDTEAPTTTDPTLTVAENGAATAIGIPAPSDPNYAASQLTVTVTALPTDGAVLLSNGTTAVTVGETLTVAQLTGLEFQATAGVFGQSSTFTYSVEDPVGLSAAGSEVLAIGPDTEAPTTTDPTLTVAENGAATAIGIPAPSDPNYAASQLTVTVTALPTDGAVLLSNGTTAVTVGETLTVTQLTGLEFQATAGVFGQSSTFTYSVEDPAGLSATGSETLTIAANTTTSSSSGLTVEASQSGTAVEVTGTVELGGTSNIVIYEAPAGQPIGPGNQLGGGVTTVVNVPDGSWTANLISGLSPGTYEIEAVDGSASAITSVTVSATPTPVGSQSSTVSTGGTTGSSSTGGSDNSSQLITAPTIPQPTQPGDIVGLVLQNNQSTALSAQEITFGQVFGAGLVPAGSQLEAVINGVDTPVQMDVKTTNADGSAASVVLTMMQPSLAADSSTNVMLALAPAGTNAGTPVNIANLTDANYNFQVNLGLINSDGTTTSYQIDGAQALQNALATGTASYWLQGPQATEVQIDVPIAGSLHVTMDITDYANGTTSTQVEFNNNDAMQANGGAVNYNVSISQNGQVAFQQSNIDQIQYTSWAQTFYSNGAPQVNIQQDIQALENTGAIQAYDLTTGISAATIAADDATLGSSNFGVLGPGNITQYMPTTGGRGDIGTEPDWMVNWLVTQNQGAAEYALAQANAAGSIPWQLFDPNTGTYLTTADYPTLWTDPRSADQGGVTSLTQPISSSTGWAIDPAHEPDVAYVAYLMTGNPYDLNLLNAEASYDVLDENSLDNAGSLSALGTGIVTYSGEQVRESAWDLREVVEAAFINPAGSSEKAYFTQAMDNSFIYLLDQAENSGEGQASGWIAGIYGSNNGAMAPWQQDYFATTVVLAAEQGVQPAIQLLAWETNFLAGAFLNAAQGFSPYDGAAYNLNLANSSGQPYQTWEEVEAATEAAGTSNNGTWANMGGDYGALAQAALAGDITVSESPEAIQAYGWVAYNLSQTQWPISAQSQFDIVPRLSDGNYLTPANMHFSYDAAGTTNTLQYDNSDQLIYAGAGNDTLIGGSGINLLFAGSGNDTLEGGPNNNYLYGGSGTDIIAAGAGTNFLVAGTGQDTFVFNANDVANDTIDQFKVGTDQLLIQAAAGSNLTAAGILASATTDANNDVVLHLSTQQSIDMVGITKSQLTATMISIT